MSSNDKPAILLMLGNEAIARGAIEGGVQVAAAYPGTPSTEIVETLASMAGEHGLYVEWSTNEKVAFEVTLAASYCGLRSLAAMKHVGLNVASDALFSSAYTGVRGGFLIVSADDPDCHSSQNEQDNRVYGLHAYVPVVEPSTPQEAKDIAVYALELSELHGVPVILRTTTRLSHARGPVKLGPLKAPRRIGTFDRNPEKFVCLPHNARRMRLEAVNRLRAVEESFNSSNLNAVEGSSRVGVIACGLASAYVYEALEALGLRGSVSVLKLLTVYPLPRKTISSFLEDKEKVLVVEELEPFVEVQVKALCHDMNFEVSIHGKDLIPLAGELTPERVLRGLTSFLGLSPATPLGTTTKVRAALPRPPVLCAGCPHRSTFYAIKAAVKRMNVEAVYPSDIGCYTLGYYPPLEAVDTTICMGAGVGLACGLAKFSGKLVVATVGDSTFFHACIPALINAVHNSSSFVLVILDNGLTAMTGGQPDPVTGVNAMGQRVKRVLPEDLAKACGVEFCRVADPYDLEATMECIAQAIEHAQRGLGPAVVVARRKCALTLLREHRQGKVKLAKRRVNGELCSGCTACIRLTGCPALALKEGRVLIEEDLCTGCSLCESVCPRGAISTS
ncbi:MAG: indolepyruvate ferredoxin oxidoreductase subunit alpha [Candidatus Nezhaarchaeota archaeon]|nr:indolepyruvate ferredoxin oxidoreductase subunit alpha [Candidatus Nezhaarchaeota archaeon]